MRKYLGKIKCTRILSICYVQFLKYLFSVKQQSPYIQEPVEQRQQFGVLYATHEDTGERRDVSC